MNYLMQKTKYEKLAWASFKASGPGVGRNSTSGATPKDGKPPSRGLSSVDFGVLQDQGIYLLRLVEFHSIWSGVGVQN